MLRQSSVLMAGFALAAVAQADFAVWACGSGVNHSASFANVDDLADGRDKSGFSNHPRPSDSVAPSTAAKRTNVHVLGSADVSLSLLAQGPEDRDRRRDEFRGGFPGGRDFRRDDSRRGGDTRGDDNTSSRTTKTAPPPKVKVVLKLPAQYTPYDKNGDQQIGLYEWDRTKLAEFLALDRNGDGFLTARELDDPVRPTAPSGATGTTPAVASSGGSVPAKEVTITTAASTPTEEADPEVRRAKYFFSLTDKDKNGEISVEEWGASRGVRVMFEKAKSTATPPFKEAAFIEHFKAIKKQ